MITAQWWGRHAPPPPRTIAVAAIAIVALLGILLGGRELLASAPATAPDRLGPQAAAGLATSLTRTATTEGGDTQAILTPLRFFQLTGRSSEGLAAGADRAVTFVTIENSHSGDLAHHFGPILRIDGTLLAVPTEVRVMTDAVHHRTSAVIFGDVPASVLDGDHTLEMLLPGAGTERAVMTWSTPVAYGDGSSTGGMSPGLVASLFAGLLASMWPCLLQLSAYFLPSVAGLSLSDAERGVRKAPVLRTAVFFVSGIVLVYTVAGAAAGFAAQSLSATTLLEDARRPITIVAGLIVLGMAARIAVQARAPLVCKMPVLGMAGRFGNGPLGTMVLGLAFATGCMTCFGAALVLGMFAYVFTTASPLAGAITLFLFSLGIAVPLVVAAVAMSRVLPLLGHLERNARYLSIASAGIMAVYGVLLLSGSTHLISDAAATLAR